ncbi:MAG TPA: adenylate/guanylate cyclase domain-containing protein [Spirochaetia bacterium]|nr:adenylate/guanylate cyclase domain-containing protein [Spirochaetia bacterium]
MGVCLVVDDETDVERLICQRFRHEIRDNLLTFHFAKDGQEAIDVLRKNPGIDMVLTDINMPRMDGLTLLQHVPSINPVARTVVVSAYGDMGNIRTSMNRGAFDFVTKPIDFEDLRATMEKTLKYVQQIKQAFLSLRENSILRMYVNPSIMSDLKQRCVEKTEQGEPNGLASSRRIDATVMFIDICGFTRLSETEDPEHVSRVLNRYFDEIARITLAFGGVIDKFIGDAAMVVFEGDDHVGRAVSAGLAAIQRIGEYKGKPLTPTAVYPDISIGLNCGAMVCGNFGSTSIGRLDYTVIGDTVNTASRLESAAGGGQLYIPEHVKSRLPAQYSTRYVGEIILKNKTQPVRVHEIITGDASGETAKT